MPVPTMQAEVRRMVSQHDMESLAHIKRASARGTGFKMSQANHSADFTSAALADEVCVCVCVCVCLCVHPGEKQEKEQSL